MPNQKDTRIFKDFTLVSEWNDEQLFIIRFIVYRHTPDQHHSEKVNYFKKGGGPLTTYKLEDAYPFCEISINAYECAELKPCGEMHFCAGMEGTLKSFVELWKHCYEIAREKRIVMPSKLDRNKALMEPSMHF